MPLRRIAAPDAVRNLRTSGVSSWPPRTDPELNRVEPICKPRIRPKFHLRRGERVFAIGSCYVRNIEQVLADQGFTVVTGQIELQDAGLPRFGANILNNFGLPSTLNELRWALDPKHPFDPETCIEETLPGQYVDLHVPPGLGPASMELVLARRKAIAHAYRKIRTCSVILLTLGLVEVWYDTLAGVYLNYSPPKVLFARYPGRFELQVLSIAEASDTLNAILDLLALHCPEDHRVLLEVSPIPLLTTHTDEDVIVATSYSKSVLRAIAGDASARRSNVDYVPSFEAIMMSDRSIVWLDNQHHVDKEVIAATAERMILTYIDDEGTAEQAAELLAQAEAVAAEQNIPGALELLEPLVEGKEVDPIVALRYAELCEKLERHDEGIAVLGRSSEPLSEPALVVLTRLLLAVGRAGEALKALTPHVRRGIRTPRMAKSLVETHRALGQMDKAVEIAQQWSAISARSAEPLRKIAELHTEAGDVDAADAAYRAAMAREPGSPQIQFDYAIFLFKHGRATEGLAILDAVKTPTPFLSARAALIRRQYAKADSSPRVRGVAGR